MHIRKVHVVETKRFADLTIDGLLPTARLVVLAGPNGSGKSSLFDVFRTWKGMHYGGGWATDRLYLPRAGQTEIDWGRMVAQDAVELFEPIPQDEEGRQKLFYIRSAYRNESDFTTESLSRTGPVFDAPKPEKMIDPDSIVSYNYRLLVSDSIESLFDGAYDESTGQQIREQIIGEIQESMGRVFLDLQLTSLGSPLRDGTFYFDKGASQKFHYKNLSGGEKAAFDLILDLVIKRRFYDDSIYCIDEPEAHVSTRLQAQLLAELMQLVPERCQLWIATHSIGMMKQARDMQETHHDQVVFLDFGNRDFDAPVVMTPVPVDRSFWAETLNVALGDLAALVAPRMVVMCEGHPATTNARKAEFDAACYRVIFGREYPDVDFLSVGNADAVQRDQLGIGKAIQTLLPGTTVLRLVDRDDRSTQEIADLQRNNIRVLSRRQLESFLLDDEVLTKLCEEQGQPDKVGEVLASKQEAIQTQVRDQCLPDDDLKSARGAIYERTRRVLQLRQPGNSADAFLRDTLAQLITPDMSVYENLKRDVFGE